MRLKIFFPVENFSLNFHRFQGLVEKLNERQPTADDEESYLLIPQAHMTKEHFVPAQKFLEHLFHYEIFSGSAEAYYLYGQVLEVSTF